jgi:hypothetical protein
MGKVSLPRLQKQLAYREVSHHCLQARKPPNGTRFSRTRSERSERSVSAATPHDGAAIIFPGGNSGAVI